MLLQKKKHINAFRMLPVCKIISLQINIRNKTVYLSLQRIFFRIIFFREFLLFKNFSNTIIKLIKGIETKRIQFTNKIMFILVPIVCFK